MPDFCDMFQIMMSVPPNTEWLGQSYSKLEMICSKNAHCPTEKGSCPKEILKIQQIPYLISFGNNVS